MHPISGNPGVEQPGQAYAGTSVVGLQLTGTATRPSGRQCGASVAAWAFSSTLRGLKLVPSKWRGLVPGERRDGAQSHPPAPLGKNTPAQRPVGRGGYATGNTNRWAG